MHQAGGTVNALKAAFELDHACNVDGLKVIDGIGWETPEVAQVSVR